MSPLSISVTSPGFLPPSNRHGCARRASRSISAATVSTSCSSVGRVPVPLPLPPLPAPSPPMLLLLLPPPPTMRSDPSGDSAILREGGGCCCRCCCWEVRRLRRLARPDEEDACALPSFFPSSPRFAEGLLLSPPPGMDDRARVFVRVMSLRPGAYSTTSPTLRVSSACAGDSVDVTYVPTRTFCTPSRTGTGTAPRP
ncbi:hypothetical protein VTK73DRAFT_6414 [Phialemonium thermophilum]|uniref:Uncharacterized protein n=1 Tax=Phialemonium thermophilum TaxID=223376 RepID=A0ABR3UZJ9_9PEZI